MPAEAAEQAAQQQQAEAEMQQQQEELGAPAESRPRLSASSIMRKRLSMSKPTPVAPTRRFEDIDTPTAEEAAAQVPLLFCAACAGASWGLGQAASVLLTACL